MIVFKCDRCGSIDDTASRLSYAIDFIRQNISRVQLCIDCYNHVAKQYNEVDDDGYKRLALIKIRIEQ